MTEPAAAARWLAEAMESGNPLAPLPPDSAPVTIAEGQAIAAQVLEALGLVPCGLRLARGPQGTPVPGPLLEARLLRDGAVLSAAALPNALARPGLAGLLAAPLEPGLSAPPQFSSLHAALDIGTSRFRQGPTDDASQAADLGGLGLVVLGRPRAPAELPALLQVALRRNGNRPHRMPVDPAAALGEAAAAARQAGGLPAGALLLVVFGPGEAQAAGQDLVADCGPLGRVRGHLR